MPSERGHSASTHWGIYLWKQWGREWWQQGPGPGVWRGFASVDSVKQNERYGQLTLVNSTAADTGEFSCWGQLCNGYICRKDEAKMGSTYIFFTGKMFAALVELFDLLDLAHIKSSPWVLKSNKDNQSTHSVPGSGLNALHQLFYISLTATLQSKY